MPIDIRAAEQAVAAFLRALGLDPDSDPELKDTPARVSEAFSTDLLTGYDADVAALLAGGSNRATNDVGQSLVVLREIAVATTCPHHLMPALGQATVAYIPGDRLLGIGTLASLVNAYARRLTLQETIGERVAQALVEHAGAVGACCELVLVHSCMNARGTRQTDASVRTLATAGSLALPEAAAQLALALGKPEPTP
ncbi:MAG TPA: GTP cyclohydrolase I [Polyangiaceae bacterium]